MISGSSWPRYHDPYLQPDRAKINPPYPYRRTPQVHARHRARKRKQRISCPVLGADHALELRLEATVKSRFGLLLTRGFQADGDFRRFLSPDVTYLEHNVPCRGGNYKQDIALLCTLKLHNIDKRLFWSEWHPICQ